MGENSKIEWCDHTFNRKHPLWTAGYPVALGARIIRANGRQARSRDPQRGVFFAELKMSRRWRRAGLVRRRARSGWGANSTAAARRDR